MERHTDGDIINIIPPGARRHRRRRRRRVGRGRRRSANRTQCDCRRRGIKNSCSLER